MAEIRGEDGRLDPWKLRFIGDYIGTSNKAAAQMRAELNGWADWLTAHQDDPDPWPIIERLVALDEIQYSTEDGGVLPTEILGAIGIRLTPLIADARAALSRRHYNGRVKQ